MALLIIIWLARFINRQGTAAKLWQLQTHPCTFLLRDYPRLAGVIPNYLATSRYMPCVMRLSRMAKEMWISAGELKARSASHWATDWQFFAFWIVYSVLVGSAYALLWKALVALIS